MSNNHDAARHDMDRAAAGERMVNFPRTQAHLRVCDQCKAYFNKLGAEGRHREGQMPCLFERNYSRQVLEAFIASLPSLEEVEEKKRRKRYRRRAIVVYGSCFLGGVAAMLLYLLLQ